LKTKVDNFATVLFGGASGLAPAASLRHMLTGFFRGLCDEDTDRRFHGITFCETDQKRYNAVKRELYRLASTPLFHNIEVTIDEIELPPPAERRVFGVRAPSPRESIYLIVRREKLPDSSPTYESSVLTAGAKATVIKGVKEVPSKQLRDHLNKIERSGFTFPGLEKFGRKLCELVLPPEIATALSRFPEHHLVVVHDAPSSRIPWETLNVGSHFPAAAGGMSRRYVADNLSIAKWLEQRRYGPKLDVLLIIDPTENLDGAKAEGKRIQALFDPHASSIKLDVMRGPQARKKDLLERFASGKYDVVHYAGHAFFDPLNPARSGIKCHRGEILSGADLAGVGNLPGLMFFNACEAGRIRNAEERKDSTLAMSKRIKRNVGLAEAFLRGGVANYVGTYWSVGDSSAQHFAEAFYGELIKGTPIGEALLEGRRKVQELESVDWADYILYGSPEFVLKIR